MRQAWETVTETDGEKEIEKSERKWDRQIINTFRQAGEKEIEAGEKEMHLNSWKRNNCVISLDEFWYFLCFEKKKIARENKFILKLII